ncbi:thioesterase family protein [Sinorhizobium sp. BG8]|uniref:acyl-CoA thioesterase n=1 Tax=Sinorhizobium sp. BG8 TaxID=2613773 RepID=UPI00193D0615|nr:thioesterase family protein [Sinorhizobium sp. BG8]
MEKKSSELTSFVVHQWQCDHFGHLNVRHYASMFDDAIFVFWNRAGLKRNSVVVPVTASMKLTFRSEVSAGTVVRIESLVERVGGKSVTIVFRMLDSTDASLLAESEVVEVFFDLGSRESRPVPDKIRSSLELHS